MIKLLFSGSARLVVLLLMFRTGMTKDTAHCPPSACGGINISYPFRLQTDPITCGDDQYNLSCENNFTVLYLFDGGKYYVQAINYDNFRIRLVDSGVDKDDCSSLPSFTLTSYNLGVHPYTWYKYRKKPPRILASGIRWLHYREKLPTEMINFIKCKNPVNSSVYCDTSLCINSSTNSSLSHPGMYLYAYVGEITAKDLRYGCSLEMMSQMLPKRVSKKPNSSFIEVHRQMAFGFELSWHNINCRNCSPGQCYLNRTHHFQCARTGYSLVDVIIYHIRWEGLPIFTTILYVLFIAKALCGAPCVSAFLIYKWRRRHLSGYTTIEEFLQAQNNLMPIRPVFCPGQSMEHDGGESASIPTEFSESSSLIKNQSHIS
ncbi:hypothetical protein M5689_022265 [Euphorbia peplus]|nr:hypothetical protein M5689_022265 [Euphorbia peplus]